MKKFLVAALAAGFAAMPASAGVVIGATGVTASAGLPSGYGAPTALGNIIDQSGLSANYVSGVTDFATFAASTTACYACTPGGGYYSELGGVAGFPATITFSFAGPVMLDSLVVWNQSGSASLNSFDLLDGATLLGSFVMPANSQNFPQPAAVFSFAPTALSSITMRINSNYGYSGGTILNEVAFGGVVGGAVPEPATWAMMIGGFAVAGGLMRRRARSVSFA